MEKNVLTWTTPIEKKKNQCGVRSDTTLSLTPTQNLDQNVRDVTPRLCTRSLVGATSPTDSLLSGREDGEAAALWRVNLWRRWSLHV